MKKMFTVVCALSISYLASSQTSINQTTTKQDGTKVTPITVAASSAMQVHNENTAVALPEVIAMKEMEYNFGKIPQGKPVTHTFVFTNTGKTAIALDNVQASCGCTTPEWNKEKVAPGATSKINVGYNAANEGPFTKFITITYNGTQTKQVVIKGEVWKTPATSAPLNTAVDNLKNQ